MIVNDALVLIAKASVVLGGGLTAGRLLRRATPAMRHRIWSATLAAALALPVLAPFAPRLRVAVPGWRNQEAQSTATDLKQPAVRLDHSVPRITHAPIESMRAESNPVAGNGAASAKPTFELPSVATLLAMCWLIGAVAVLGRLALAIRRSRLLASSSLHLRDAQWLAATLRLGAALGVRAPVRLVVSPRVVTPMAGGVVRPTIFLPALAPTWSDDVRDVVLAHELAHIARRDPVRHLVSRAALAVYWFHPLAWLVARRAVTTCEQACDDAVLTLGIRPSTYAGVLLDFASARSAPAFAAALPIVRPSQLEDRLMAILNSSRRVSGRRGAVLIFAVAAVATPLVAAVQPARVELSAPAAAPSERTPESGNSLRAPAPVAPTADQRASTLAESACTWSRMGSNFSGTMIETGGSRAEARLVGRTDNARVVQTSVGDVRVCAVAEGMNSEGDDSPSAWPAHATRVLLETRRDNDVRAMEIAGGSTTWTVNGEAKPVDAAAQAWRDRLLALLDPTWQLSELRGRVSSLRGEISSVEGQRSSMEGEISSLHGQVSSMQGEISSVRGQVSSMEGEISSVRGHLSSLRGQMSSERGAISSLDASGGSAADIKRHEDNIRDIENEIARYDADGRVRQIEARIAAFNADSQVAAIEQRIRTFDVNGQEAAVRQRIDKLDVAGQTRRIEGEIQALHEDTRAPELQTKIDAAERQLRDLLGGH